MDFVSFSLHFSFFLTQTENVGPFKTGALLRVFVSPFFSTFLGGSGLESPGLENHVQRYNQSVDPPLDSHHVGAGRVVGLMTGKSVRVCALVVLPAFSKQPQGENPKLGNPQTGAVRFFFEVPPPFWVN